MPADVDVDVDVDGVYAIKILASPLRWDLEECRGVWGVQPQRLRMALVGAIVIILIYVVCCSCFSSIAHTPRWATRPHPTNQITSQPASLSNEAASNSKPAQIYCKLSSHTTMIDSSEIYGHKFLGNKMPRGGRTFPFPFSFS